MVEVAGKLESCGLRVGIPSASSGQALRLHKRVRFANFLAPLRMTDWLVAFLLIAAPAFATTYYVSSSTGSDGNSGMSSSSAWQTIGHVNAQTFQPGDSVLFRRGDVWNESLIVPSSGSSGNPITFDAYGTGPAPNLTGYYAAPASTWVHVSGNAWKAPLPATYSTINFCLFGSIWGQKVGASTSNLTAQWNFYFADGYVYVYATENPSLFYNEPIVPMALSNMPVINTNGQSWLTFQHFLVNWFDQYGVYVEGESDHLVFANMESDSMIPEGTQPLGFYVNEAALGPGDIKLYNDEAHLNYDGFRFDGSATAITMVNDKAYANRDGALVDNTSAVSYSYCHFYASSLAVAGSTDVEWTSGTGPIAGTGNIATDTPPAVQVWKRYPAEITLTVDDSGMTPGADTYYANTVLPVADAAGLPVGAAITVGYPLANTLISEFQGWINAGRDVTSHSISHTYYTNTDALDIQYTGTGTAATLSISNKTLTITVTGASDSVSYNLAQGQPEGTMLGLAQALAASGKYTYSFMTPCQGPYGTGCAAYTAAALLSQDLADISSQDVKSAVYHMPLDVARLTTDEITLSRQWMTANLTGLPATPVYVYPGGYETTTMQGIAEGVPYSGARGALKEDFGVKDTYADGFNAQNVTSFGVNPTWMGIPPASLNQHIHALVWKEQVWGVPWGIFWHLNELTQADPVGGTEITNLIQDFKNSGAIIQTNTGLVNWLMTGTQETGTDGNYYYTFPATRMALDFRPTENSPVVDAGQNLGPAYALDINGVNQNSYGSGWEIGAHVYEGYSVYGGGAGSWFSIGAQQPAGTPQLPQAWVDNNEATDGLVYTLPQYELNLGTQAWVNGPPAACSTGFHLPYWTVGTPTFSGLQSAINDVEACRTTTGGTAGFYVDIPPALYTTSSANGLVIPQSNSNPSSAFIVLRSTEDSNLPDGQTVCAHGIQDDLVTSTDIGLHNPDCTGQNMYDELGPQNSSHTTGTLGIIAGITTLSVNTTTLAAIAANSTTQCVALTNGYVSPGINLVVDSGANQETVGTVAAVNQTGACGVFTLNHASGVPVTFCAAGCTYTLANGQTINTANYNDVASMWQVETTNTGTPSAITLCSASGTSESPTCASAGNNGPDHWMFEDGATSFAAGTNAAGVPFDTGAATGQTSLTQLSQHIHITKWWTHGDWTSPLIGGNQIQAGIHMNCIYCSFTHSQISQVMRPGAEGHPIGHSYGSIEKDVHNWVEGLSGGVFCGGFSYPSPNIAGVVPCQDMEIRRNRFTFPYSWMGQSPIAANADPNFTEQFSFVRKNSFEIKVGLRWVVEGNINENIDNSGAQSGNNALYRVTNSSVGQGDNYQGITGNIFLHSNIYRNSCSGPGVAGRSDFVTSNGGGASYGTSHVWFQNDLLYQISVDTGPGCTASSTYGFTVGSGVVQWSGNISEDPTGTFATFTATCAPQLSGNCPNGPISGALGAQQTDINPGDYVVISGCTSVTAFNTATGTNGSHTYPLLGVPALAGTFSTGTVVLFPNNTAGAGASDTSGNCIISYQQGWPNNVAWDHITEITDNPGALSSTDDYTHGPNYARNNLVRDSIFLGNGWYFGSIGEGTTIENFNWDSSSLTADHLVFPTRTAANYTEYGNNPGYPDSAGCTRTGCNPPSTMYFPPNTCIGWVGACSSSVPLTYTDYHSFELSSSSSFFAGNSQAASDGTSMGTNIPALDAAQTLTTFVCPYVCGVPGPYADVK